MSLHTCISCLLLSFQFASVSRDTMLKIWTMDDRGLSTASDEMPKKKRKKNEAATKVR